MLTLPEQLLILALDDKKGEIHRDAVLPIRFGLAGAALIELALREKVEISNKKLILKDDTLTGNNLLDTVITQIKNKNKNLKPFDWIVELGIKDKINIKKTTADSLVNQGILTAEQHKILGIFNTTDYPAKDSEAKLVLKEKIRKVVLNNDKPEKSIALLIGLVNTCELTNQIFSKGERKEAKKRIKELNDNNKDSLSEAVAKTVDAVHAGYFLYMSRPLLQR